MEIIYTPLAIDGLGQVIEIGTRIVVPGEPTRRVYTVGWIEDGLLEADVLGPDGRLGTVRVLAEAAIAVAQCDECEAWTPAEQLRLCRTPDYDLWVCRDCRAAEAARLVAEGVAPLSLLVVD